MRYPFLSASKEFLAAYQGVYADGMIRELGRRYPKIGRQLQYLRDRGLISTTSPAALTADDIKEYVRYQRQRGLRPASISHDVSAIKLLCIYTADNNCVAVARTRYPLLFPSRSQKLLPVLERPAFDLIVSSAARLTPASDLRTVRCYAEVLLGFGAGLRTQEIQYAKAEFLSADLTTIFLDHVKGQGTYGQSRTVPIRPECRRAIGLWLQVRPPTAYLFEGADGGHLSVNSLTKDRGLVIRETGVTFDFRKARRTYGQYLVDEGLPTDKLSVILGHSTSKTTEKSYARPRDDRVVSEILNKWS